MDEVSATKSFDETRQEFLRSLSALLASDIVPLAIKQDEITSTVAALRGVVELVCPKLIPVL